MNDRLTPELLWAGYQAEAEDLLKADGRWIADDAERNRRINAAYARLWLADRRFQWAGLAAFASKQVGCGLLHAAAIVDAERRERALVERGLGQGALPGARYGATLKHLATEMGAASMARRLGHGNTHVFLDLYPLHRFYMERGLQALVDCLPHRQLVRQAVRWEVARGTLAFAAPFPEVRLGFEQIERGLVAESVATLARHEQLNLLQRLIYDDPVMQLLLDWNQLAWACAFPSGDYQQIVLQLSARCQAGAGDTLRFPASRCARLWDPIERMPFVLAAAARIDALAGGPERGALEASLRAIGAGPG